MNGPAPSQRMQDLAATAMIGTDRSGAAGKPDALLTQAAVLGTQARAGLRPRTISGRIAPCPPDATPIAGPAPTATLMRLLRDPDVGLLSEWSELASQKKVRVADAAVPLVLDWWSRQPRRPEVVFAALGTRGEWLASLNPAWRKPVAGSQIPENVEEVWQTGKTPERVALLQTVRRHDPSRALAMVRSTWEGDGADEHRRFIEVLRERVSMADEPFLEAALDDKSKLVRRAAAAVLSLLLESRLTHRMNERARGIIVVEASRGILKRGVKVSLSPPKEFDASWERDAIEAQPAGGIGQRAWWMRQIFAAADLSVWTTSLARDPGGVLEAIASDDYAEVAVEAISEAAALRRDAAWSAAIIRHRLQGPKLELRELQSLWSNLAPTDREPLVLETAQHKRFTLAERWTILSIVESRWSRDFTAAALKLLGKHAQPPDSAWDLYDTVDRVSRWIAPDAAEQFVGAVEALFKDRPTESFQKSIDRARFRASMHKEFAS